MIVELNVNKTVLVEEAFGLGPIGQPSKPLGTGAKVGLGVAGAGALGGGAYAAHKYGAKDAMQANEKPAVPGVEKPTPTPTTPTTPEVTKPALTDSHGGDLVTDKAGSQALAGQHTHSLGLQKAIDNKELHGENPQVMEQMKSLKAAEAARLDPSAPVGGPLASSAHKEIGIGGPLADPAPTDVSTGLFKGMDLGGITHPSGSVAERLANATENTFKPENIF